MKKKVMFSLIALMAIVLTGFSLSENAQPAPATSSIYKVKINGNSLVQRCATYVVISFNNGNVVKEYKQPYTGASEYYFEGPAGAFNGTVCANIERDKGCSGVMVAGQCATQVWAAAPSINVLTVNAYIDEL